MADETEEKNEMMSQEQLAILRAVQRYASDVSERYGNRITLAHTGAVTIADDANEEEIRQLCRQLAASDGINGKQSSVIELGIAALVNDIAGRTERSIDDIVDELKLCDFTERSPKTIRNWCRAQMELRPEDYHYGLTLTHYVTATGFAAPEDDKARKKFIKGRSHLLAEAAEDPVSRGKTFIADGMKRLQEKLGVEKKNKTEKLGDLTIRALNCLRIIRQSEDIELIVPDEGQRKDLMIYVNNAVESDLAALAERGKIDPSIDHVVAEIIAQTPPDLIIEMVDRETDDGSSEEQATDQRPEESEVDPLAGDDDPLSADEEQAAKNPQSESEDTSDWSDADFTEALSARNIEVNETDQNEFTMLNTETGAETVLDSDNLTDALSEAWSLTNP